MTLIQAALNGDRTHPGVPKTPPQIVADAQVCAALGARLIHVHCFDDNGAPSLAAAHCDRVIAVLRRALPNVAVSLTTSLSVEPDPARRLNLVQSWRNAPDYITLNFSEVGVVGLGNWFLSEGGGVEACLASEADAYALALSPLRERASRAILEVSAPEAEAALRDIAEIEGILAQENITLPQYHHGRDAACWAVFERALRRGHNLRTGLEDVTVLPDGRPAPSNEAVMRATCGLDVRTPA